MPELRQLTFPTELHEAPARPGKVTDILTLLQANPSARVRALAGGWYLIRPGAWDRDYLCQKVRPSDLRRLRRRMPERVAG